MSLKRRERREQARRSQELRAEVAVASIEEGKAMENRSDDYVPVAKPPDEARVMISTAWGPMEAWKAKALAVAQVQTALRADEAPDKWADTVEDHNAPRLRDAVEKEEREMRQGQGWGEDCSDGGEKRTDKSAKMKIAKAVAHLDQDDPEKRGDPEEADPVLAKVLARVVACLERFSSKLDDLDALRRRNQELEGRFGVEDVESARSSVEPQQPLPLLN
jgi:hypothetical protein